MRNPPEPWMETPDNNHFAGCVALLAVIVIMLLVGAAVVALAFLPGNGWRVVLIAVGIVALWMMAKGRP